MKKELKDYLHLYLGCKLLMPNGSIELLDGVMVGCEPSGKPILRPLSDITPTEVLEICKIEGLVNASISGHHLHITAIDDSYDLVFDFKKQDSLFISPIVYLKKNGSPYTLAKQFEITRYLLSKGIDIFGLIEDNLAVSVLQVEKKEAPAKVEHLIMLPSGDEKNGAIMWFENQIGRAGEYNPIHAANGCIRQHLYAVSEEEGYKKGDPCMTVFKTITIANEDGKAGYRKKIVSSTDKLLTPDSMLGAADIDAFVIAYNIKHKK